MLPVSCGQLSMQLCLVVFCSYLHVNMLSVQCNALRRTEYKSLAACVCLSVCLCVCAGAAELDSTLINKLTDDMRSVVFDVAVRSVRSCVRAQVLGAEYLKNG